MTINAKGTGILLLVVLAAAAIATGVALWHNNATAQMPGPGGRPPFDREEMMKRFDTDGDGQSSQEEREAMREAMDNFRGMSGRRGGGPPFGMAFQTDKLIKQFDDDADGKLNDGERRAAREYIQEKRGTGGASPA